MWDTELALAINGLVQRWPLLDGLIVAFSHSGNFVVPGLVASAYWVWCRRREALIGGGALVLLILLVDRVGKWAKYFVGRDRPCQVLEGIRLVTACGGSGSFPSNHAVNTAAAAMFLQVLYPRSGWVSWPIVVLVGFSRVYMGAHYPTDILGSWVIGGVAGASAALLLLRWPIFRSQVPSPPGTVRQTEAP